MSKSTELTLAKASAKIADVLGIDQTGTQEATAMHTFSKRGVVKSGHHKYKMIRRSRFPFASAGHWRRRAIVSQAYGEALGVGS
jgi:hypothetical protein